MSCRVWVLVTRSQRTTRIVRGVSTIAVLQAVLEHRHRLGLVGQIGAGLGTQHLRRARSTTAVRTVRLALKDGGFNHYRVAQAVLPTLTAATLKPDEVERFERLFLRLVRCSDCILRVQ